MQPRALHLDRAGRLDLLGVLDYLVHVRAHAQQHGKNPRPRIVQADFLDQQSRAGLAAAAAASQKAALEMSLLAL